MCLCVKGEFPVDMYRRKKAPLRGLDQGKYGRKKAPLRGLLSGSDHLRVIGAIW